jgi:type III pantothenate kinase
MDVGNTRVKIAREGEPGVCAVSADDLAPIARVVAQALDRDPGASWRVATVNPPVSGRIVELLRQAGVRVRVVASAADVAMPHHLTTPETTGADRALQVLAAWRLMGQVGPGIVISCGTALVVERIDRAGVWHGGAIAPGLRLAALGLHGRTAQLPAVEPVSEAPAAFGTDTRSAIEAGVFWSVVGASRELIARQSEGLDGPAWRIWTGGDGARIAAMVDGPTARIVPGLVLQGLAALGDEGRSDGG